MKAFINKGYRLFVTGLFFFFTTVCIAAMPNETVVTMQDNAFSPATITVSPGTKVIWINKGKNDHTVTSENHIFNSARIHPGERFSYTFEKPGTYSYACSLHSFFIFGMKGKVIVK